VIPPEHQATVAAELAWLLRQADRDNMPAHVVGALQLALKQAREQTKGASHAKGR